MIRTLMVKQYWNILKLFYVNHNTTLHLRAISRKINLKESATSRHLNTLEKQNILKSQKEANLKKYNIKKQAIPEIFSLFAAEKFNSLPLIRKNAIKEYIRILQNKPLLLIIFGSTAKGTFTEESDIDILEVCNKKKIGREEAKRHAEAITGIKLQFFRMTESKFYKELKLKQDNVIQAALATGFPVFNNKYFYELINNE